MIEAHTEGGREMHRVEGGELQWNPPGYTWRGALTGMGLQFWSGPDTENKEAGWDFLQEASRERKERRRIGDSYRCQTHWKVGDEGVLGFSTASRQIKRIKSTICEPVTWS